MLEDEQVALFLAARLIARGNKGTLLLTIMILAMVFVNLIFLPSIIAGVVVLFNQQTIDYSFGNLIVEPKEGELRIADPGQLVQKINGITGWSRPPRGTRRGARWSSRGRRPPRSSRPSTRTANGRC